VKKNYESGLNIDKYDDIKIGDIIEAYEEVEVARKL
jgi:translation initiation factor IF-2